MNIGLNPQARKVAAMLIAAVVGLIAGLLTLRALGQPTPLG